MADLLPSEPMPGTACIDCPKAMVGRVIGKGGETIKALQQYTGAMIQIDQSTDPTRVTIAGTPSSLQLAVSMVNDIVCGHFKGFALLRQLTQRSGQHAVQPQPVYVEGYGFVPLSQDALSPSDMLLMAAQQKYSLRSQSLPAVPSSKSPMGQASVGLDADQLRSLAQELNNPFLTAATLNAAAAANSLASGSLDRVDVPSLTTNLTTFDESNGMDHATSHAPNGSSVNLPTGWMHIADPDGRPFYYNLLTKQSQWQAPLQDVM